MQESTVTMKGQTTLPKDVRLALGLSSGDRVRYVILDGEVRLLKVQPVSGLAGMLSYFEAVAGDWRYIATHLDVLEEITPAEIREAAARYFTARNRTVVTLAREGESP